RATTIGGAVAMLLFLCSAVSAADAPVFPAPPRLATTAEELTAQRKLPEFAALRANAQRAAALLLKTPAAVPDGPGDWTFYYACPEDGSSLHALNAAEHQCPRCRKIYRDERTVAAYR